MSQSVKEAKKAFKASNNIKDRYSLAEQLSSYSPNWNSVRIILSK